VGSAFPDSERCGSGKGRESPRRTRWIDGGAIPGVERMRRELRVLHYSLRTDRSYLQWAERFLAYHSGELALDSDAGVKM
jgi:hypothetical protein